jgi:glucose-1-phosphate cytidylyltransferase
MKIIILAGGLGTRISEETNDKPKPMVLINNKPILWHLMNIYSIQGFNEFIISTGYKSDVIENWILNNRIVNSNSQVMKISTVNTGINTQTGGRISEVMRIFPGETVMATYGDGLANIPISQLLNFHESHKKLATLTAVRPPARFGHLVIDENKVVRFGEKNQADSGWINGGFFILEPQVIKFIESINEPFESGALTRLTENSELIAYKHRGFWQPMDTLREMQVLEKLASLPIPPWLSELESLPL